MILTQTALKAIHNKNARRDLSGILDCTDQTIMRYIDANEDNGPLTTIAVIDYIKKNLGLTQAEILEKSKEPIKAEATK